MDTAPETVAKFCRGDQTRERRDLSIDTLRYWQEYEKSKLKTLCNAHGILLTIVPEDGSDSVGRLEHSARLLGGILSSSETMNELRLLMHLGLIFDAWAEEPDTFVLLDADKTLAPVDAADLFWAQRLGPEGSQKPLKGIFSSPQWGYTHKAFVRASRLYQEIPDAIFDQTCDHVAKEIVIHPEFEDLLRRVSKQQDIRIIVITAGIKDVWERVLRKAHLSDTVAVLGGEVHLPSDGGVVVTPTVKAAVVKELQSHYGKLVYAFGDSEIDIPMLKAADHAFVVSGDIETRSKRMDVVLDTAIRSHGLQAKQVLLPPGSPRRLAEDVLPVVEWDETLLRSILMPRSSRESHNDDQKTHNDRGAHSGQEYLSSNVHFTDTAAAKLLMTSMRDAKMAGPALRAAHQRVGWFLATWALSETIGLEGCPIDHVQGHEAEGHRLRGENQTTIVALMRGGEPMALGVSEAFPSAVFVHANQPEDVERENVIGQETIVLVDSVVNTGKSVIEFIAHIRKMNKGVRIVVVAGVVQANFFDAPPELIAEDQQIHLVTLRVSDNRFKGQGTTDTGNRLYNTTHLD